VSKSAQRNPLATRVWLGALLTVSSSCFGTHIIAQQTASSPSPSIDEITVTAKKVIPDEEVTAQVETALQSDPYVLGDHVTITTKNGVVTLHGLAMNYWDVQQMKRIAKKMPGVRKVVNDLDVLVISDGDDGW
jgi:osmotically-inducible protein OsmY